MISTSFLLVLFLFRLQGPPLLKGKWFFLAEAFVFGALKKTDKCNDKAGVCTMQTFTGMAGVANGWQWSNGQPNRDYGICSVQCAPLFLFFPFLIAKHSCLCKTSLAINPDPVVKYFKRYGWMLMPPTPTEILKDIPFQRHPKCIDTEKICCKNPNRKPRQTSWECEGQNGFLCVSLLLLPHTPTISTLSLSEVRQTFRAAEMSQGLQKQN